MQNPNTFYKQELQTHEQEVKSLYKQLTQLSFARLFVFVATCVGLYFAFSNSILAIIIGVLGFVCFMGLLSKYTALRYKHDIEKALVSINEDEITIASGDYFERPTGEEYQDPKHAFSLDIDLFGRGSFFQFINRTAINEGTETLANALTSNNITAIEKRQKAIKELANKPLWRQYFTAVASLIKVETPTQKIVDWLQSYTSFLPKAMKWLPLLFSVTSILLFVLVWFHVILAVFILLWLVIGLGISGVFVKRVNNLSNGTSKAKETFKQYALLLNRIEEEPFLASILKEKQQEIKQESLKASAIFSQFSKQLDALDNRNNMIIALLGNGFFLNDIKNTYRIEQWINTYKTTVSKWFDVVAFFDAYNTLGNFAFNNPEYAFPELATNTTVIQAKNLTHPLLNKTKRIPSDVTIGAQQFFIVTGANMAGKSTFLRTVSLHIVMANVGLPVCAEASVYSPVKLITSMRTSDSLTDDSSYFFSELTRLKFIVDALETDSYFIILDEILKGTNSTDKAIGSRKFVEKLVSKDATGIIATHDLSLCEITETLDPVKNYFFDAQIVNDELFFDYKLKHGICQNMNASFLLKKMEII